jgi:hypothetical protein
MKLDRLTKVLLAVIALFLGVIALHPLLAPQPVRADNPDVYPLYIEPGTTTLRSPDGSTQVLGKVMVDMSTGNIWGFPSLGTQPYPMDSTTSKPPVSSPMYLGKFDFTATRRQR